MQNVFYKVSVAHFSQQLKGSNSRQYLLHNGNLKCCKPSHKLYLKLLKIIYTSISFPASLYLYNVRISFQPEIVQCPMQSPHNTKQYGLNETYATNLVHRFKCHKLNLQLGLLYPRKILYIHQLITTMGTILMCNFNYFTTNNV